MWVTGCVQEVKVIWQDCGKKYFAASVTNVF